MKRIENLRKEYKNRANKREVEDDRFEGISKDVKKLLRYRSRTINSLESSWSKKCSNCNYIKPLRSHHCSICNRCVFLMDHHCRILFFNILLAWVNNCLGLENYRYFLLFIFYLLVGTLYFLITVVSIWNHHLYVILKLNLP